jgi:phosphoglucosamine mutase
MPRLFGTDGVRGLANGDLTPELALSLAASAAHVLGADAGGRRPMAVVGRDTRASGEMLEAAVVAGLTSAGADVVRLGVLPTPGVAFLVGELGADLGVMLSASHNPMPDNGIKFFDRAGAKLADSVEDAIEARLHDAWERPTGADVGRVRDDAQAIGRYADHLVSIVEVPLDGLRMVVDCAHGAASGIAPDVYARAGADVVAFASEPDGYNINDGVGSTHLDGLAEVVRETASDVGIAHDGDADRCLAVDAHGEVVDGDQILAVCALALHERGALAADSVVATVMANLGFKRAMARAGIAVVETAVGDRYVLEAMTARGLTLGGEQSGHVIFRDVATTGDGLVTALRLLSRMAETRRGLAELVGVMERFPQVLLNVPVRDKSAVAASSVVNDAVAAAAAELADEGRILLRPSGTEPVVRVMVEAPSRDQAAEIASRVAAVVERAAG